MKVLVIRRDNIGDLVCTLPMLSRLREAWPDAWIGALVTSYNAEVLHDNPELDAVFRYTKAKHLASGESALGAMLARLRQLWQLRRIGIDLVLLPAGGSQASARRMARLVGARRVLAQDDVPADPAGLHEVLRTANFLRELGLPHTRLPAARIVPHASLLADARVKLGEGRVLGIHISARKPSQRWPVAHFVELIQRLHREHPALRFGLFWAPGASDNPLHPGDDAKARQILEACPDLPVVPMKSHTLAGLIGGLAACSQVLCSDGGHMHLAAALGKPIVCLFGKSDAERWHPWGVPYRLIQPASQEVKDISIDEVFAAVEGLI